MRLVTFVAGGRERVGTLRADDVVEELEAPSMIEWLAGRGRQPTGATAPLADVRLLAPVPSPPSIRDFYAYEDHVRAGFALRGESQIAEAWYEAPVFYFSNPAAIHGPGEAVRRPPASQRLDFELEIAAVIGAEDQIAGFTLLNDWSARDVQRREMTVGLGPAKGKDFAISLGPWLVTPDELQFEDGRLALEATATRNGEMITRSWAGAMHFSWTQLTDHAARDTRLRTGDVLGSGTLNGGCLLELGGDWLEPGEEIALAAAGLGELRTPIVG